MVGRALPDYNQFVHDTMVVRVLWCEPGKVSAAWEHLRQGFADYLQIFITANPLLQPLFEALLTGYSLLYQADTFSLQGEPDATLLQAITGHSEAEPLVSARYEGGRLWLLAIPAGLGLAACSTYFALLQAPSDAEREARHTAFVNKVMRSPGSHFLNADLVAHKAYYQHYFWQNNLREPFTTQMAAVFDDTNRLMTPATAVEFTNKEALDALSANYAALLIGWNKAANLEDSLQRQQYNLQLYITENRGQAIWQYHLRFVAAYLSDWQLLMKKTNVAMRSAQTAIAFVSERQEQLKARQEQLKARQLNDIQLLIGVLGAALAALSLLKGAVIIAWYHRWPWPLHPVVANVVRNVIGPSEALHAFVAEFTVTAVLAAGAYILLRRKIRTEIEVV